jgi:hypothetical protein
MWSQWLGSLLFITVCLTSSLAQQPKTAAPARDPLALQILQQAVGAVGGLQAIDAVQTFSASGRVTVYRTEEGTEGEIVMKGRGLQEFRVDTHLDGIDEWWFIAKGGGFRKQADGKIRPLIYQEVANIRSFCLPWVQIAQAIRDSEVDVSFLGTATREKRPTLGIRIYAARTHVGPGGIGAKLLEKDFYIDSQTFQLVSVDDFSYPMDRIADGIRRRVVFSDYRAVQGTLFPFAISEQVGHRQRLMAIHLNEVQINASVNNHDFEP